MAVHRAPPWRSCVVSLRMHRVVCLVALCCLYGAWHPLRLRRVEVRHGDVSGGPPMGGWKETNNTQLIGITADQLFVWSVFNSMFILGQVGPRGGRSLEVLVEPATRIETAWVTFTLCISMAFTGQLSGLFFQTFLT